MSPLWIMMGKAFVKLDPGRSVGVVRTSPTYWDETQHMVTKSRYTNVKYHCEIYWYFSVHCLPQSLRNYKEEAKIKPSEKALAMPGQSILYRLAFILSCHHADNIIRYFIDNITRYLIKYSYDNFWISTRSWKHKCYQYLASRCLTFI